MAIRVIESTDSIEVKQLACLIYGQPGSRKTSMCQTCEEPYTMAFDEGIYRAYGRKRAAIFDAWEDVVGFDTAGHKTIIVDTIGKCLAMLGRAIIADNPKNGNRLGGLTLPGYGILKTQFSQWVGSLRARGCDVVFVAQEASERIGDENYFSPDIVGSNYNTTMENADIVGYLHFMDGKRVVHWTPSDRWMAKTPPCGWTFHHLPDFGKEPEFLGKLLAEAKESMGRISAESAAIAADVEKWAKMLGKGPSAEEVTKSLPDMAAIKLPAVKRQVWTLLTRHSEKQGWTYDKATKTFIAPAQAAEVGGDE